MIRRAIIQNYKGLRHTEIEFGPHINILVGDNETGKSTVLEALNLALTAQLNRRSANYELHPFLFNQETTATYVAAIQAGQTVKPPEISIELYLEDVAWLAELKGSNNSRFEDCPGIRLRIALDDNLGIHYQTCIGQPARVSMIPTEYYHVVWESFALGALYLRTMKVKPVLIDPGAVSDSYGASRYVQEIARDHLTPSEQANLALSFRNMREAFQSDNGVSAINAKLAEEQGVITSRRLSVGLDMTAKANWETSVQPHLDDLPLSQIGKGEQNAVKIKMGLKGSEDRHIVLIEEPENHLSHTNLNRLISDIAARATGRQLIITTHSSFVLNKLGVQNTLMFNGQTAVRLSDLPQGTRDYFMKLPGHDTLRMVLATRTILVEGPSDELIVQRAYHQEHGRTPLEDGVEVISVSSLAFKRFLDIARLLGLTVVVVTDNDGKPDAVAAKYTDYGDYPGIRVCYSSDANLRTLEPHLLARNGREKLNRLLGKNYSDDQSLVDYMEGHKTECALKLFECNEAIDIPDYIAHAVA